MIVVELYEFVDLCVAFLSNGSTCRHIDEEEAEVMHPGLTADPELRLTLNLGA